MRVLITGIAGFYGSHLARYLLDNTDWDIVGLDRIDTAGNLNRLKEIEFYKSNRTKFVFHDFRAEVNKHLKAQIGDIDIIFHVGAMSHVDRSIQDPLGAVMDNVVGTCNMLEYARTLPGLQTFLYFSTDEVFGPLNKNQVDAGIKFKEWDRYNSGSPYSASKAGAEELCLAYHNTYNLPVVISHCMNIYGEYQHPEKFIPKIMRYVEEGRTLPIYADMTGTVSGTRLYIYADSVSEALMFLSTAGQYGQKYNIEGEKEMSNMDLASYVSKAMGRTLKYKMVAADNVRPGNDFAYGISGQALKDLGFDYKTDFDTKINDVIKWYLDNPEWYRM